MERATMMKTFHGTLKSPTSRDRDASFSSYLQPHHHHQHHTIGSNRCRGGLDDSTSELSIFDAHKYFNEVTNNDNNIQKVTTTISSSSSNSRVSPLINNTNNMVIEGIIPEIKSEIITETRRYSSASSSIDGYNSNMRNYRRTNSFHAAAATPTASSEASWNSQAGLLSHPPGSIPVPMMSNPRDLNKKIRASLSKPIWFLKKKCPCSGKKSVEIKEKKTQMPPPSPPPQRQDHETLATTPTPKMPETLNNVIPITPNNWVVTTTKSQRFHSHSHKVVTSSSLRDGFTFPVLNPQKNPPQEIHEFLPVSTIANNNTKQFNVQNGVVEDPARDSLEVFQPPCNNDTMELQQVTPKSSRINIVVDEDAHSDASSDLFEIESFSTTTAASAATQSTCGTCHPVIYRRRDSMDEASSTNNGFFFCRRSMDERSTTTEYCYEPSEASIEWSVTTAAAEDESGGGGVVQGHGEKWKRKGSSSLVSCRSEKAVSVGPQPVKAVEGHRGATCSSRHVSVSSSIRAGVSSVNKPPLARAHNTACMSLAFAT